MTSNAGRSLIADIIKADAADPIRDITIEAAGLRQVDYGFRRVGGKRNNWWEKGIEKYWDKITASTEIRIV